MTDFEPIQQRSNLKWPSCLTLVLQCPQRLAGPASAASGTWQKLFWGVERLKPARMEPKRLTLRPETHGTPLPMAYHLRESERSCLAAAERIGLQQLVQDLAEPCTTFHAKLFSKYLRKQCIYSYLRSLIKSYNVYICGPGSGGSWIPRVPAYGTFQPYSVRERSPNTNHHYALSCFCKQHQHWHQGHQHHLEQCHQQHHPSNQQQHMGDMCLHGMLSTCHVDGQVNPGTSRWLPEG